MTWQDLMNKIKSNRSPLTYVITNDKIRFLELCFTLQKSSLFRNIYIYDGWRGLQKFTQSGDLMDESTDTMQDALTIIYSLLYKPNDENQNAVIIKNYDDGYFLRFLTFVAQDYKLLLARSHLFAIVDDITNVPVSLIEKVNICDIVTTHEDRVKLIKSQLKKLGISSDEDAIARTLSGLNLDQTEASVVSSIIAKGTIDFQYLQQMKRELFSRKGNLTLLEPQFGFEAIGGYAYLKEFLTKYVISPCRHPELSKKLGVELPKGILLFGIEGTGKTILAKALGKELNLPVVQFHSAQYRSKYFGETEQRVKSAIKSIKELSPCIVFIDEIEHLGYRPTGETDSGTSQNVFTMLLSFMSETHGNILVGTTNKIERLDEAFMRAGRLDYYLPQMLPDADARKEIFKVHTEIVRHVPLDSDIDINKIVEKTKLWNGAEIELLIKTASLLCLNENMNKKNPKVSMAHFEQAFSERKVDTQNRLERMKMYQQVASKLCTQSLISSAFAEVMNTQTEKAISLTNIVQDYQSQ